jgi:inositol transport system substrate-binding protein
MRPTRRDIVAGLAAAVASSSCGGPAPRHEGRRIVIGVSLLNLASEFIVMLERSMQAKARDLAVELILNDAQLDAATQVRQVENFVVQKVDAIVLNPCEVESSSPAVDKAVAGGIPIVNVNSETRSAPTAFVGSSDEESGRIAMGYIAGRLHGQGNVVMIDGFMGQAAQIKRDRGAREILARNPGLHLLAAQTAGWDRAKAMTLMENWIQSYGARIDAVFAQNDEMAMGALIALEQARRKDKVIVTGVDAIADALQAVKNGRLDATVFQDAAGQGGKAIETAVRIVRKEPYDKETFIPFQLVTRQDIDRFLK